MGGTQVVGTALIHLRVQGESMNSNTTAEASAHLKAVRRGQWSNACHCDTCEAVRVYPARRPEGRPLPDPLTRLQPTHRRLDRQGAMVYYQ